MGRSSSRSRSPSPHRRKHRSKSRERDRDRRRRPSPKRRSIDRERDRGRDRDRERERDRDRLSRKHYSRSRSRSPVRSKKYERPTVSAADLQNKTNDEQEMLKVMGFCTFDTTKGKQVEGNDAGAVHVILKRKYRQYMNRKGGFNRPLDFVA
ncbi:unnamed protein product [Bemisia tabaci]|uniref:U4/U6.U5 small nuclear ribonucleoprotein 27 kDa protein n=1 Tax=Bemisia tabaci TaxID=7038 RepID=A0A9P0ALW8_BEMTA|nr:unnamed protein product [Bemisia tabaci]